jgi:hypothetical protein
MSWQRTCATLIAGLVLWLGGCKSVGLDDAENVPTEKPSAIYAGLAGQKVAIMVWADWRTRTEGGFSQIQLDMARLLQQDLEQKEVKSEKKKNPTPTMQFVDPRSIVRYQREHPEITFQPILEVAPRLGASRVIYVEIDHFQIQSPKSILLLKGEALANLRVVEVSNGQAKLALEEKEITALYPPNAPEGAVPSDKINERTVYEETLIQLSQKLAGRFKIKE